MTDRYRRMKGWNGTVYMVRMTEAEIHGRRNAIVFWSMLAVIAALAAGIITRMSV